MNKRSSTSPTQDEPSATESCRCPEADFQAGEEHFRLAFENANIGMCLVDLQGRLMRVNAQMSIIFGYSRAELEAMTVNDLTISEDAHLSARYIRTAIEGNHERLVFEKRYRHRQGRVIYALISSSLVRDAQGRPLYFISQVQDISRRKRAEQAMEQALIQANRAAQTKRAFLAHMTHELRTPLHAILGFTELLERLDDRSRIGAFSRDDIEGSGDPGRRRLELLGAVRRNARHLLSLVNDLLDLSHPDHGQSKLLERPADLRRLLRDCIADFTALARHKGLALELEFDAAVPAGARLDRRRLTRILGNLLDNAIKFTERGRVLVRVETDPESVTTERVGLRFSVLDTGAGIEAADQARLFEPFFQVVQADGVGLSQGVGLGLPICRQLAELMGGELRVESTPGIGSRFTLSLSVARADATAESLPDDSGGVGRHSRSLPERVLDWPPDAGSSVEAQSDGVVYRREAPERRVGADQDLVLVIDDERDSLRLTLEMLGEQGLAVVGARDGRAGLRLAAARRPDLVLLEIRMPGPDGFEVCSRLKADPATRDIPVIFLSACDRVEDRARAFAVGAVDYVVKPFEMRELRLRLINHLRLSRQSRAFAFDSAFGEGERREGVEAPLLSRRALDIFVRARVRMLADLTATPDLTRLAHDCGTNRTSLQRLFQTQLGLSVFGYLREQRLQRALVLLREGWGVDAVAREVGYGSGYSLSRAFKQRFGIPPGALSRVFQGSGL